MYIYASQPLKKLTGLLVLVVVLGALAAGFACEVRKARRETMERVRFMARLVELGRLDPNETFARIDKELAALLLEPEEVVLWDNSRLTPERISAIKRSGCLAIGGQALHFARRYPLASPYAIGRILELIRTSSVTLADLGTTEEELGAIVREGAKASIKLALEAIRAGRLGDPPSVIGDIRELLAEHDLKPEDVGTTEEELDELAISGPRAPAAPEVQAHQKLVGLRT